MAPPLSPAILWRSKSMRGVARLVRSWAHWMRILVGARRTELAG